MSPIFLGPLIKRVERRRKLKQRRRHKHPLWWLIVLEIIDTARDLLRRPPVFWCCRLSAPPGSLPL